MARVTGAQLRTWRQRAGWDVPETARQLRRAAGDDPHPPDHDTLVRAIRRRAWDVCWVRWTAGGSAHSRAAEARLSLHGWGSALAIPAKSRTLAAARASISQMRKRVTGRPDDARAVSGNPLRPCLTVSHPRGRVQHPAARQSLAIRRCQQVHTPERAYGRMSQVQRTGADAGGGKQEQPGANRNIAMFPQVRR